MKFSLVCFILGILGMLLALGLAVSENSYTWTFPAAFVSGFFIAIGADGLFKD